MAQCTEERGAAAGTTGDRQHPDAGGGDGVMIVMMAEVLKVLNIRRTREVAHLWLLGRWAYTASG